MPRILESLQRFAQQPRHPKEAQSTSEKEGILAQAVCHFPRLTQHVGFAKTVETFSRVAACLYACTRVVVIKESTSPGAGAKDKNNLFSQLLNPSRHSQLSWLLEQTSLWLAELQSLQLNPKLEKSVRFVGSLKIYRTDLSELFSELVVSLVGLS